MHAHEHLEREQRTLRDRHAETLADVDALAHAAPDAGPQLVATTTKTSYPTSAGAYYAVQAVDPGGTEGEGNAGTLTTIAGIFYAINVGQAVPDAGTQVVAIPSNGRWTFDFNG